MKSILLALFLTCCLTETKAQLRVDTDSILFWHFRKVEWKDFKGVEKEVDKKLGAAAITGSSVTSGHTYSNNTLKYYVYCRFLKYDSWTKINTAYGLNHERRHFDISEISARRCRQYYASIKSWNAESLNIIGKAIDSLQSSNNKIQELYDIETDFGRDKKKQKEWDMKIDNLLKSLEGYKQPKGAVVFKP